MKLMIVDDDRDFRKELTDMLRHAGYEVESFGDSVAAINGVHRVKPQVILLDIKMDKLNGYQAAWYFRKFQETALIPIIGMSGGSDAQNHSREAIFCGMDDFLKKPFNPLDLIAAIERVAESRPAAVSPPGQESAAPSPG